jgi:segregation and condensation protein B
MEMQEIKRIIEALIFVSDNPISVNQISEILKDTGEDVIRQIIQELNEEYKVTNRSFTIQEVAGGFRMVTKPELAPWLRAFYRSKVKERLTRPSLETLAIIAYKQPVTKPEIEAIRGVNVDGVITTLLDRNLIRIAGRKDTSGRPLLYATTDEFLEHFGLKSLSEIPKLPELQQMTDVTAGVATMKMEAIQENIQEKQELKNDAIQTT